MSNKSYSVRLERLMVDFGCTHSFEETDRKLQFHHGIEIPRSASRRVILKHGILSKRFMEDMDHPCEKASSILSETDGCMVPIITYAEKPEHSTEKFDKRKHKHTLYQEAKLSMAQRLDGNDSKQSITFQAKIAPAETIKPQLQHVLNMAGYEQEKTHVHVVGDGAKWIFNNYTEITGKLDGYLIDWYHLGEYLYPATKAYMSTFEITPQKPTFEKVYQQFKEMALESNIMLIVAKLKPHIESKTSWERPIRKFIEYVEARPWQFHYKEAAQQDLPIGSGLIESSNKTVVQKRLKTPGAWWKKENANKILSLKAMEMNGANDDYWHAYKSSKYL